ncbi:hypothetical protein [Variovorax sp. RCC_210]|uniref:hypothetical protein n=1 Tax=Variovorax sp. RCC_210 TaxID=3239217 RepID=UPI0035235047
MARDCNTELLEIVEQETLVETQRELLVEVADPGAEVADIEPPQMLVDTEPDLLVVTEGAQIVLVDEGRQGPPGPPGGLGQAYVEFPAAVPLGGHRAVRLLAGQAIYADHTVVADANAVLGITRGAVEEGALAQIQFGGLMTEPSWAWTPDQPVFVGLEGVLTQPSPTTGFSLIVGIATLPTQILIGAKAPIVLQE